MQLYCIGRDRVWALARHLQTLMQVSGGREGTDLSLQDLSLRGVERK